MVIDTTKTPICASTIRASTVLAPAIRAIMFAKLPKKVAAPVYAALNSNSVELNQVIDTWRCERTNENQLTASTIQKTLRIFLADFSAVSRERE